MQSKDVSFGCESASFTADDTRVETIDDFRSVGVVRCAGGPLFVFEGFCYRGENPRLAPGMTGRAEILMDKDAEPNRMARCIVLATSEHTSFDEWRTYLAVIGPDSPRLQSEALGICARWLADRNDGNQVARIVSQGRATIEHAESLIKSLTEALRIAKQPAIVQPLV